MFKYDQMGNDRNLYRLQIGPSHKAQSPGVLGLQMFVRKSQLAVQTFSNCAVDLLPNCLVPFYVASIFLLDNSDEFLLYFQLPSFP